MVDSVQLLNKYFDISSAVEEKFVLLGPLYQELNSQVNVISRKDIDFLYLHHILHSLSLAQLGLFNASDEILDLGTGGGFPGIPLAVMFPDCHFTLIDGTLKKIKIVETVIEALELSNVDTVHTRAEEYSGSCDFVICRAVATTLTLLKWAKPLLNTSTSKSQTRGGILLLKGGDLTEELQNIRMPFRQYAVSKYFEESYFAQKYILYFSRDNLMHL